MRAYLFFLLAGAATALGSCYDTGDLGPQPFQCRGGDSNGDAACPDNYQCLYLDPMVTTAQAVPCGTSGGMDQTCICGIQCNTTDDCHAVSASGTCNTKRKICVL